MRPTPYRLLLLLPLLLNSCGTDRQSTTPTIGPITSSVYASGRVKAKEQYTVYATVSGILREVFVVAGDSVVKDQVLFTIDDRSAGLVEENARLAAELAAKEAGIRSPVLREREEAVRLAYDKLAIDSLNWTRQKSLWDQHIGSQAELEQRELAYRAARTARSNAVAALEDARDQSRLGSQRAINDLQRSSVARGDHQVRSLMAGRVFDVGPERGELVTPQLPLAVVGDARAFLLELQVDEIDIARVKPGLEVLLSMDSQGDSVYSARVAHVDPIMDPRTRTFTVEAFFEHSPPVLYPNLTAEANIVIARDDSAMTVPAAYLVDGHFILNEREERVPVVIGLRDAERVQILSGIDPGTTILEP